MDWLEYAEQALQNNNLWETANDSVLLQLLCTLVNLTSQAMSECKEAKQNKKPL